MLLSYSVVDCSYCTSSATQTYKSKEPIVNHKHRSLDIGKKHFNLTLTLKSWLMSLN